ncbi:glutathione S-transferase [Hypoxylon sp. NC1633]|nr:glutathione S-transferase [Hypoxylon sp. NC1633]
MAPFGKIYSYPGNFRVARALVVAAYNGLEVEVPAFKMGVENMSPEFKAKFPLGKVPALECADGFYELSGAIVPIGGMVVFKMAPFDQNRYDTSVAKMERALKTVEAGLQNSKYLVGDTVTLADIIVAGVLWWSTKVFVDAEMRKDIPKTVAYLQGLAKLPEFKPMGDLVLCETRSKP